MLEVDINALKKALEIDFPFENEEDIDRRLSDFPSVLSPELHDTLSKWLEDRTIQDVQISGISLKSYMAANRLHFLSALKGLHHLQDPEISQEKKDRIRGIYLNSISQ